MREDLDKKLVAAFPNLYQDRFSDMKQTCMCWGFSCADGWFKLIWDLSEKLERLILAIPEEERKNFRALQVKEKYGGLRFYMVCETKEMSDLIEKAELESERTCESCGRKLTAKIRGKRWVYTMCLPCELKRRLNNKIQNVIYTIKEFFK